MPRVGSDEYYILDVSDRILGEKSCRQYRGFEFLKGSTGRKLPVDSYYPNRGLVIEYHEIQHFEAVSHFDKPWKLTASGIPRSEQRKLYDDLRRSLLPANGVKLLVLSYLMFPLRAGKRLLRTEKDCEIISEKMREATIDIC